MERSRILAIVIVAAVVCAGVAAWLTKDFLREKVQKTQALSVVPVVVAVKDLPVGSKLEAANLKVVTWPRESVPSGSFPDAGKLVGRQVIRELIPGDAVTESKLLPEKGAAASGIMTYIVKEGHRAVTVRVDDVAGVAGFLVPGNRVDVIVTTLIPHSQDVSISKIVLQNVPVLATGQLTEQKEGKPTPVTTVTLDLLPEDTEKLAIASQRGTIHLILRNALDVAEVKTPGETVTKLLQVRSEPVKVKAAPQKARPTPVVVKVSPPPGYSVEVIRGVNRSTKQFSQ